MKTSICENEATDDQTADVADGADRSWLPSHPCNQRNPRLKCLVLRKRTHRAESRFRDRWLEHVNENENALPQAAGKYEVCRQIEQTLTPALSHTERGKLLEAA